MPKEREPSRKAKSLLKDWCKVRIIPGISTDKPHRPTAKLWWSCEVANCNRTYTTQRSLIRHKKETHDPPGHHCACASSFKRLEYLMIHQDKCGKRHAGTQTDDHTIDNKCVLCYKKLLTQFSRQSPSPTPDTKMTMAPSTSRPTFKSSRLSDSSDEEDPYIEICTRKKTRPTPPVYTHTSRS
jgi:hypothetical protein